jgi:hypothetical protein
MVYGWYMDGVWIVYGYCMKKVQICMPPTNGTCKLQDINALKKDAKNMKFYLELGGFSFYICTPQEGISSLIKLRK